MKAFPQVTCVGEALVDLIATKRGVTLSDAHDFTKYAGGSAANIAVGLANLGIRTAFVGRVGKDPFGKFLGDEFARHSVDCSGVIYDPDRKTRLAFVSRTTSGDRDFEFWERQPAGEQLRWSDIDLKRVVRSKIVHIGSFLLLQEPSRSTALRLAEALQRSGCILSFDPNLRLSLWRSKSEARRIHLAMVKRATILRLNAEEAFFLTKKRVLESAVKELRALGPSTVVVTMGNKGCYASSEQGSTWVKGFRVKVADTTGCGDGFFAALLAGLVRAASTPHDLSLDSMYSICRTANAVGALTATRYGVIGALPTSAQVRRFLSTR